MKKKVLDITNYDCPLTFIKAKNFINKNLNNPKIIIIKGKTNFERLKNSLEKNFEVKSRNIKKDIFELHFL